MSDKQLSPAARALLALHAAVTAENWRQFGGAVECWVADGLKTCVLGRLSMLVDRRDAAHANARAFLNQAARLLGAQDSTGIWAAAVYNDHVATSVADIHRLIERALGLAMGAG